MIAVNWMASHIRVLERRLAELEKRCSSGTAPKVISLYDELYSEGGGAGSLAAATTVCQATKTARRSECRASKRSWPSRRPGVNTFTKDPSVFKARLVCKIVKQPGYHYTGDDDEALDQLSRYADLSLVEEDLIAKEKHVFVSYIMKPKAGSDYLATADRLAAESSVGTNANMRTTEDFAESMDAMLYCIGPQKEDMNIAYPNTLFDGNIIDKRAMMSSVLKRMLGNNQGMGDVEYWKIHDIYFPPAFLRFFDSKAINILDMWRILGGSMTFGGLAVGTIIEPELGLQPKPFGEACYACWQGGDFIKIDEPQDVEYTMIDDIYFPPAFLRFFGGPANNILDRWRIFGRSVTNGGLAVGTIIQPELGLQLTPFGVVCYDFWLGGDYKKIDEPQGSLVFCRMTECYPEVVLAMRACVKMANSGKLFSANLF